MMTEEKQMGFRNQIYVLLDSFPLSRREKFETLMSAVVVAANCFVDRDTFFIAMNQMYDQIEEHDRCQREVDQI